MKKGMREKGKSFGTMGRTKVCLAFVLAGMMLYWPACGGANEAYDTMASSSISYTSTNSYVGNSGSGILSEGKVYDSADAVYEEAEAVETGAVEKTESEMENTDVFDERKLIKTVDMNVETKEYDRLMDELQAKVSQLGGYIESMDTYNGSSYSSYRSSRSANLTIRIPKDKLNSFLETVEGISNVVRRSENVEDVTLSYVDMESRKNTLKTEQDRLLELLEKAESIDDIITIEERLSNVRYQLESMESQLRTIDNQVDYSTVYLDISEVKELTPVQEQTAFERIGEGFVESMEDIGDGAVEFAIWFVVNIPYFVVWAVIITVAVVIVRACRKRSKEKKAKKLQGAQMQANVTEKKE